MEKTKLIAGFVCVGVAFFSIGYFVGSQRGFAEGFTKGVDLKEVRILSQETFAQTQSSSRILGPIPQNIKEPEGISGLVVDKEDSSTRLSVSLISGIVKEVSHFSGEVLKKDARGTFSEITFADIKMGDRVMLVYQDPRFETGPLSKVIVLTE